MYKVSICRACGLLTSSLTWLHLFSVAQCVCICLISCLYGTIYPMVFMGPFSICPWFGSSTSFSCLPVFFACLVVTSLSIYPSLYSFSRHVSDINFQGLLDPSTGYLMILTLACDAKQWRLHVKIINGMPPSLIFPPTGSASSLCGFCPFYSQDSYLPWSMR